MPRTKQPRAISESELTRKVIAIAHTYGWIVSHFTAASVRGGRIVTPVQADGAGFPDLVLVRERVIFVELKARYRKPEPKQVEWIERLRSAGAEVYVWYERDLETVETVLELNCPRNFADLLKASDGNAVQAAAVVRMGQRNQALLNRRTA